MLKGTIVALATPLTDQDGVDYGTLHELIEWHRDSGTDGIVLCGTTGEAPTLSDAEQIKIFKEAVLISKGGIPIIAGTGSYDTRHCVEMTEAAKHAGVDGALIVVPYYSRPTPEGCFQHFREISKVELPMIVYHHPGRIGIKLPVQTLLRIAELPYVVAIKDSTADLDYAIELIQGANIPVLTGDDTLVLPIMAVGGVGVISVIANLIPREWKQLTALLANDQWKEARDLFNRFFPLAKAMFMENNPQCVKYALGAMGKCSSRMRLPLVEPQEATKQHIMMELAKAGLLPRFQNHNLKLQPR
jgi:4-hydroxy-tetrahydrodipicolinate synthase